MMCSSNSPAGYKPVIRLTGRKKPPVFFINLKQRTCLLGHHELNTVRNKLIREVAFMKRLFVALALILAGCAPIGEMIQNAGQPTAKTASATEQGTDQAQLEPYSGPKARVGVYRFTDQTAKGGERPEDTCSTVRIPRRLVTAWPRC